MFHLENFAIGASVSKRTDPRFRYVFVDQTHTFCTDGNILTAVQRPIEGDEGQQFAVSLKFAEQIVRVVKQTRRESKCNYPVVFGVSVVDGMILARIGDTTLSEPYIDVRQPKWRTAVPHNITLAPGAITFSAAYLRDICDQFAKAGLNIELRLSATNPTDSALRIDGTLAGIGTTADPVTIQMTALIMPILNKNDDQPVELHPASTSAA